MLHRLVDKVLPSPFFARFEERHYDVVDHFLVDADLSGIDGREVLFLGDGDEFRLRGGLSAGFYRSSEGNRVHVVAALAPKIAAFEFVNRVSSMHVKSVVGLFFLPGGLFGILDFR